MEEDDIKGYVYCLVSDSFFLIREKKKTCKEGAIVDFLVLLLTNQIFRHLPSLGWTEKKIDFIGDIFPNILEKIIIKLERRSIMLLC